nr:hypothetical protein [Tanacetum cinerariifolium]
EELSWNSTDDEGADDEGKDCNDDEEDEGDDGKKGDGDDDDDEDDDGKEGNDDDDAQEVKRDDDKDDEDEGGDDDHEYDDEYAKETRDEESFVPILKTPKNSEDEGNGEEYIGLNIGGEEGHVEEEEEDELYRDININQGREIQVNIEVKDSHVTLTPVNLDGQQLSLSMSSQFVTSMLNPTLDVVPSTIIQNLPNFGSLFRFDDRLRSLEANFSEAMQTDQFAGAVSAIPGIVQRYMDQRMNEAVKVAVQIQFDRLQKGTDLDKRSNENCYQEHWQVKPEGQQYPHNLLKPLPLIPNNRGRRVIPFEHFINNDLEYLRGGTSSRKYTTSITKTKAVDYGHIKWIEDLVPRKMWIKEPIGYDKHALWGVSHRGRKRQQFYGFAVNRESARDVYSKRRIIAVTKHKIVEWHSYKHLDWITDVYDEYRHSAVCRRSSTGSRKLPEEAKPYKARHISIRSKVT